MLCHLAKGSIGECRRDDLVAVPDRRTIDGGSHQPHHMTQMVRVRVKRTDNADEMCVGVCVWCGYRCACGCE